MQLSPNNASNKSQALVETIIEKLQGINKSRKRFLSHILILFMSLRGRYTFSQMARYGAYCEKTYRLGFEKNFDFLSFNQALIEDQLSGEELLVFDPSFIAKNGRKTPGFDKFWNGCLARKMSGLELAGIAVVDLDKHSAFHLEAIQSPTQKDLEIKQETLVDHYARLIVALNP